MEMTTDRILLEQALEHLSEDGGPGAIPLCKDIRKYLAQPADIGVAGDVLDDLATHVFRAADKLFEHDLIDGEYIRFDRLVAACNLLRSQPVATKTGNMAQGEQIIGIDLAAEGADRTVEWQPSASAGAGSLGLPELSDAEIDAAIDTLLRASGSALRHYSLPRKLDDMRAAMRAIEKKLRGEG